MPSTAGLPRDRPRRHRSLRSPAGVAGERQAMPSRRHGERWAECRAPARSQWPAPPSTPTGHVMDELDHAPRLAALDAIMQGAQRPASGASGLDRIVGVMSATGSHDTLPSNRGRGATMGPPGCPLQSPSAGGGSEGLQGLVRVGGLEGTTGFPDKEEVPGSSPGSPTSRNPGIRCIWAFFWDLGCLSIGRVRLLHGATWGHQHHRRAGKRSWLHLALGSVRTRRTPSRHVPSKGCGGDHELWLLRAQQRSRASGRPAGCWMTPIWVTPRR